MNEKYKPESLLDYVLGVIMNWEFSHNNAPMEFENIMQTIQETKDAEKLYIGSENRGMLQKILDRLQRDELIECVNPHFTQLKRSYIITFEGGFAFRDGYYVKSRIAEKDKETRLFALENNQKINASNMTKLTTILAVVGLLSLFIQSFDKFKIIFRIDFWLAFFLFLSGIMCGVIIYNMIMHFRNKN